MTVPGDNSVDLLTNDIGIVAFTSKDGNLEGCNFYVGGGMGRTHNNEAVSYTHLTLPTIYSV